MMRPYWAVLSILGPIHDVGFDVCMNPLPIIVITNHMLEVIPLPDTRDPAELLNNRLGDRRFVRTYDRA